MFKYYILHACIARSARIAQTEIKTPDIDVEDGMKSSPPSPLPSSFASLKQLPLLQVARRDLSTYSVFWISLVTLQRIVGCFRVHAGLPLPVTVLCGFGMITTGHYLTSAYVPKVHEFLDGKLSIAEVIMTNPIATSSRFSVI